MFVERRVPFHFVCDLRHPEPNVTVTVSRNVTFSGGQAREGTVYWPPRGYPTPIASLDLSLIPGGPTARGAPRLNKTRVQPELPDCDDIRVRVQTDFSLVPRNRPTRKTFLGSHRAEFEGGTVMRSGTEWAAGAVVRVWRSSNRIRSEAHLREHWAVRDLTTQSQRSRQRGAGCYMPNKRTDEAHTYTKWASSETRLLKSSRFPLVTQPPHCHVYRTVTASEIGSRLPSHRTQPRRGSRGKHEQVTCKYCSDRARLLGADKPFDRAHRMQTATTGSNRRVEGARRFGLTLY
ncbi:hypothetical protein C8Q74DRAFT_1214251 [Fomes fomentarius]|nr:hypothetical protein C8Q74DRAFT_1214251 [Fomes fomentarius]